MSAESDRIYAVLEDQYAYSSNGEIATSFLSPCVAFADPDAPDNIKDGVEIFDSVLQDITVIKESFMIEHVFIIGGRHTQERIKLLNNLLLIYQSCSGSSPNAGYVALKNILNNFSAEKDRKIIVGSIDRFISHCQRLNAVSVDEQNTDFVQSIEAAFNRLTNEILPHVTVKESQ